MSQTPRQLLPWKHYLYVFFESILVFYLATFCLAVFFSNRGVSWLANGIVLILLYIFVIAVCIKRVYDQLPIAALMLLIPIIPLVALISVVSLIPIIQYFTF